jgi:hypothetical protein
MAVLTEQEYQALVTVLQRAPVTPAELLSLNMILAKLAPPKDTPDGKVTA